MGDGGQTVPIAVSPAIYTRQEKDSMKTKEKAKQEQGKEQSWIKQLCKTLKENPSLIVVTALFIFANTASILILQMVNSLEGVLVGAIVDSLATIGLAYVIFGLGKNI